MTSEDLEEFFRTARRRRLFDADPEHAHVLDRLSIERLIPHRDPFLLVDRITAVDLSSQCIAGVRRIDPADPLFRGHFPGNPLYPGALQIEMMGQLGLCLFGLVRIGQPAVSHDSIPRAARALKVFYAAFLEAIRPGEELEILGKIIDNNGYTGICTGQLVRNGTICSYAAMEVYFVDD